MKRIEWIWAAGVLLLLSAGYDLLPVPRPTERASSFSEDGGGKKAFYLLAQSLLADVDRSAGSLLPAEEAANTLVMLGPARYPDRAQWQTLHDWISRGRALVFAARWHDPAVALEPFGIEIVPAGAEEEDSPGESGQAPSGLSTDLVSGEVDWKSFGHVRFTSPDAQIRLSRSGSPQVVWQPVGQGAIVVVASDYVFTNRSLTRPANGLLAFRILEAASPVGFVYFDETMNEAGAPKVVGVLFEEPFRLLTLQLLIVTLLFGWMSSRRFGPIETTGAPARRSLVEHAEALGSLHFKVGTGSRLVASYLEFFRRDLGLKYRPGEKGGHLELGRTGAESGLVQKALRAAKSPRLERERVASLIASLARLRSRA